MTDDTRDAGLLARLARNGDAGAFHDLYLRHTPSLFAMALRLCGQASDAEDVVHDTWMRAAAGAARFAGRSSVRTWLMAILINRTREARREPHFDSLDRVTNATASVGSLVDAQIMDLNTAIARMPIGYREIVLLHDVEGFTHEEIASMLGIEPGTSKSQLARARRWIRLALEPVETRDD